MTLITVEAIATVTSEGTLTVRVPRDISPGEHRVVLVLEQPQLNEEASRTFVEPTEPSDATERRLLDLPVIHVAEWPEGLSLRREDMYDDWGR
jgi:hypothetical protein